MSHSKPAAGGIRLPAKRQRAGPRSAASRPCEVVPLEGALQDDTDIMKSMAKQLAMAMRESDLDDFVQTLEGMRSRASDGQIHFGSMCTGSGLGDVSVHDVLEVLSRLDPRVGSMVCDFACELDPKKAKWLIDLKLAPKVFSDVTQMGLERTYDWVSGAHQKIPEVAFCFFGFSCKDLSQMNENAKAMTAYVIEILEEFFADPDAEKFSPENLAANPLKGSTAGTLIGALHYVRKHSPELVIMENVLGVLKILYVG